MAQQNCIIVKGEFLPEHGTSVVEYEKREMNENVNRDYFIKYNCTRYNFKVEKYIRRAGNLTSEILFRL